MGWMRFTFDTGAAVTAFPLDVGRGTHTDPSTATYKTASGEILQGQGGVRVEGTSEHDSLVAMQGRKADVHQIWLAAAQAHSKGYMSILSSGGGYLVPESSNLAARIWNS